MDWKQVGSKVASVGAGLLGTALAGPGVGAAIGGVVADALGVEATPDSISRAIDADPQAAVKLQELQSNERIQLRTLALQAAQAQLQADTASMNEVNQTMRQELQAPLDIRSLWRPIFGLVSAIGYGLVLLSIVGAIAASVLIAFGAWDADPKSIAILSQGVGDMVAQMMPILIVGLGVVGVQVSGRTKEKMGDSSPGLIGSIAQRIRRPS